LICDGNNNSKPLNMDRRQGLAIGAVVVIFVLCCVVAGLAAGVIVVNKNAKLMFDFQKVTYPRLVLLSYHPTVRYIPKVFVRTGPWEAERLPAEVKAVLDNDIALNPGFVQEYYSDADQGVFLQTNFPEYLEPYSLLLPGAFKADLWRLLYLYKFGGIYNDIGHYYHLPVESILRLDTDEFVSVSDIGWGIHNAFMAVYPRHPLIAAMVNKVLQNIEKRTYGRNSLDITGPCTLGKVFNTFLGLRKYEAIPIGRIQSQGNSFNFLKLKNNSAKDTFISCGEQLVITCKFPDYKSVLYSSRQREHYGVMWDRRKVYLDMS